MKTIVEIPDSLFAAAKAIADAQGSTFQQLIEEGLRTVVERRPRTGARFRLRDGSFRGQGLQARTSWPVPHPGTQTVYCRSTLRVSGTTTASSISVATDVVGRSSYGTA
jgi:hypothetical protein